MEISSNSSWSHLDKKFKIIVFNHSKKYNRWSSILKILSFNDKCSLEISCEWISNHKLNTKGQVFKNDVAQICKMYPAAALVATKKGLNTKMERSTWSEGFGSAPGALFSLLVPSPAWLHLGCTHALWSPDMDIPRAPCSWWAVLPALQD